MSIYLNVSVDGVDQRVSLETCTDCWALVRTEEASWHREWHTDLNYRLISIELT